MTTPSERFRAVKYTEHFLQDLLDSKQTPRVPQKIRDRARQLSKHYPSQFWMENTRTMLPEIWGEESNPYSIAMQSKCRGDCEPVKEVMHTLLGTER